MSFYPSSDTTKIMTLGIDGNLSVLGSNVLRVADEGHGKGIDSDTIDGVHLTGIGSLDERFVNTTGDTMTGHLAINKVGAYVATYDTTAMSRMVVSAGKAYIQAGKTDANMEGSLNLTGYNGNPLSELNITIADRANAKINGSKILIEANEGHGNGIDSDTLDGQHGTYYSPATHLHDERYTLRSEVDLQSKYKIQYNSTNDSLDFMYIG